MQCNKYERKYELPDLVELVDDTKQPNLLTINDDCMYHIFEYLEWTDLVNVVETSKAFYEVVCYFFDKKYSGNKIIGVGNIVWAETDEDDDDWFGGLNNERNRKWSSPSIVANTPLIGFKLLRNFGHTISSLHFSSFDLDCIHTVYFRKFEFYLVKYCWQSLKHLLFTGRTLRLLDLKKTFINIESIIAIHCKFEDDLPFSIHFPNLKSLTLLSNQYEKCFPKIGFSFPLLTQISYTFSEYGYESPPNQYQIHENTELIKLLQLNPQLEHLVLGKVHYGGFLKGVLENLPKLRNLKMYKADSVLLRNLQDTFFSETVEYFHLQNECSPISHIPFHFPRLKSLVMKIEPHIFDTAVFDFIAKHKQIKSIYFDCLCGSYPEHLQFANIPSTVEELTIHYIYDLRGDMFYEFFNLLKAKCNLKRFSLGGHFKTMSRDEVCYCLCNAMTLNGIQFEIGPIRNIEDTETMNFYGMQWKEIEIYVRKISNLSEMKSVIKISDVEFEEFAEINWYTI